MREPVLRDGYGWPARFPRVGRSIPRANRGPDEWLLLPLPGRGDRIRLTDLLRRAACAPPAASSAAPGAVGDLACQVRSPGRTPAVLCSYAWGGGARGGQMSASSRW